MKYLKTILCTRLLFLCLGLISCAEDPCADGHLFENWKVTKKETCGAEGLKEATCTRCGEAGSEAIPASGNHRLDQAVVQTPATLYEAGVRVQHCARCKQLVKTVDIPAIADTVKPQQDASSVTLDLSRCVILYDDTVENSLYLAGVEAVRDAVARYTGKTVEMRAFAKWESVSASCKILIGDCDLDEVEDARARINGNGFAIEASEGMLVIVGNNVPQTMRAAQYFATVCVPRTGSAATLSISTSAVASNAPITVLGTQSAFSFDLLYSNELDNDPAHKHVGEIPGSDCRDYPCVAAEQLAKDIAAQLGLGESAVRVRSDVARSKYELFIGVMPDRAEAESFRLTLDGHEYGILVHDGQIFLAAHNDVALTECIAQFKALLELSSCTDANGNRVYALPDGFCIKVALENKWVTDFPRPTGEGIYLYNTQDSNDSSLQYYYTGTGVSAVAYELYSQQLLSAGYRLLWENYVEGSIFKTFVNDAKGTTLYVAYNDYKYKTEYEKDDEYNVDYQKCIRVISAPLSSVTLPGADLLTPNPTYNKVADSTVTQLPLVTQAVGMGYIIRLEDGRFLVIDGGATSTGGDEAEQIWQTLQALYRDAYGTQPTAAKPMVIAAWIVTHSHWDHYQAFVNMLSAHRQSSLLRMEYMIGNFPEQYAIWADNDALYLGRSNTIARLQNYVQGGFQYIKVHTGQKLYFANVALEILTTFEDHNPRRICNSNDTSTVFRLQMANKDAAAGSKPVSMLFLGDAFRYESRYLCAMYGSYLQSEIMQLSHHGNIGCEKAIYRTIAPLAVFFPNTYAAYKSYTAGTSTSWNFVVNHYVAKELESVRYIFVADTYRLTFKFGVSGPDYEGIYDITNGKAPIAFDGGIATKK